MTDDRSSSLFDRMWNRLETRYGSEDVDCDCAVASDEIAALEASPLTRVDLEAYRRGDATVDDLVAEVEADLDAEAIDDLRDLADVLANEPADSSASTRSRR